MKILVTGGAGFIGYHLCYELSKNLNNEILIVDNLSRGSIDKDFQLLLERPNIRYLKGDLTDGSIYSAIGIGYNIVFHLAAVLGVKRVIKRPVDVLRINTLSIINLLEWFVHGGGDKIVFSSSSEVYAWTAKFLTITIPTPENVPLSLTDLQNPRSSYAGSKIFGELLLHQYCTSFNKQFVIIRYHNIYGPRMGSEHVIPELIERIDGGENPLVVYSSNNTRSFCYISDAVKATILAAFSNVCNNKTINVGNDQEEISINELVNKILLIMGRDVELVYENNEYDMIKRRCPDISAARRLTNYNPDISLDQGIKLTVDWYRSMRLTPTTLKQLSENDE